MERSNKTIAKRVRVEPPTRTHKKGASWRGGCAWSVEEPCYLRHRNCAGCVAMLGVDAGAGRAARCVAIFCAHTLAVLLL